MRDSLGKRVDLAVVLGTMAMLLVMAPSIAFNVETTGWLLPSGHKVRVTQRAEWDHRGIEHIALRRSRRLALDCSPHLSEDSASR